MSLTGSTSNLNKKLLTNRNLNDLLTESGGSSNSSEKIYSIDRMIKSLNSKINGKLSANTLHGCPSALADFYNDSTGYSRSLRPFSSAHSSSSSNGSASNSTTGSLTPCASENQSMLSSLLEGCHSSSQMNGLQPNKLNSATSKLFLLNAHSLLASNKSNGAELVSGANEFTNSTNSNLNLLHSLPYSLMNCESAGNPLSSLTNSFKPLNYNSLSSLSHLNNLSLRQFNQLNGLQANSNGVSLFGHHSELLQNYGSMLTPF